MLRLSSRTVAFAYGCGIIAELCGGCWVWHCRSLIPPPHCHCRFRPLRRRSCLEKQNEDGSMICPHPEISPLDQTNSTDWNYDCDWDWDFDCRVRRMRFMWYALYTLFCLVLTHMEWMLCYAMLCYIEGSRTIS